MNTDITMNIIEKRALQLERIKEHISIKTYGLLQQKLADEQAASQKQQTDNAHRAEIRERPQILSKQYFTQKRLPRKHIRID